VTVFGPWLGPDQEIVEERAGLFRPSDRRTTCATSGSDSFEQQILVDAEAGSAPNVAVFPAAGPCLRHGGARVPDAAAQTAPRTGFPRIMRPATPGSTLGTFANDGGEEHLYGFFYKVDVKSLVWYVPDNFEDFDYESPRPWKS
jgi:alpha-glucoside transport system substrate-binding protein